MSARLATAAVGLPLLAAAIWAGGWWFSVLAAAVAGAGAAELSRMSLRPDRWPATLASATGAVALVGVGHFLAGGPELWAPVPLVLGVAALAYLARMPGRTGAGNGPADWSIATAAALYTGGLLAYGPLLRGLAQGREWVFLGLLVTFATDTTAFFVGRSIGKRPLAPKISPGKTWEGAIAGLLGAAASAWAASAAFGLGLSPIAALAVGVLMGIVGQLGDLGESKLKRAAGVKQSGSLMPGHGGVLDRLDSIVFNLALVYHFVLWVGP